MHRSGQLLVTGVVTGGQFVLLTSRDDGRSWQAEPLTELEVDPDEATTEVEAVWAGIDDAHRVLVKMAGGQYPLLVETESQAFGVVARCGAAAPAAESAEPCRRIARAGQLVLQRWGPNARPRRFQVSTDGGSTWQQPTITPPIDPTLVDNFQWHAAHRVPTGGWLATASAFEAGGGTVDYLLRSDDGLHWRQLSGAPCRGTRTFNDPVSFGGKWYVVRSCHRLDEPADVQILTSALAAEEFTPLQIDGHSDAMPAGPIQLTDRLIFPHLDEEDMTLRELLVIR